MNKDELKQEIMKIADEKNIDLPKSWFNKSEENLQTLLNELNGEIETVEAEVVKEVKNVITPQNPFGEELIDVILPLDPMNPKKKTKFFSVNGKPIIFPLGKKCKMPKSYYLLHMDSQEALMKAQAKQEDHNYKEL